MAELDIDDFVDHSGSVAGGGFLKKWRDDGEIDVWLHPKANIYALWSNSFTRVVVDRESGNTMLRGYRFQSMETETILKKQRFREADGSREYPPVVCPFGKVLEWVHEQVRNEKMGLTDTIFKFEADGKDDEGEEREIHAGGFTDQIQRQAKATMDKDEKKVFRRALKEADIRLDEVFMENGTARLQYVFRLVQNSQPSEGTLIGIESQALGDRMKSAIKKMRMDVGDKGNPKLHPYAFRWNYDANKDFDKKYEVTPMTSLELTSAIQEQFDEEPPSIAELTAISNVAELRLAFEEHWCHDIVPPWSELFAAGEEKVKGTSAAVLPSKEEGDEEEEAEDSSTDFNHGANATEEEGDDMACDACGELMEPKCFENHGKCSECGAIYDDDPDDEESMIVVSRPCMKCETDITLEGEGNQICGKCGAIHDENWEVVKPAEKKRARRSKRSATRAAS